MRRGLLLLLLVLLMLFSSCSIQSDGPEDVYLSGTWAKTFYRFWQKMDASYGLFSLEPVSFWDDVFSTYMPRFEALGEVSPESARSAMGLYRSILTQLDDMHLSFFMLVDAGLAYSWSHSREEVYKALGLTEDEIYDFSLMVPNEAKTQWVRKTKLDEDARYLQSEYGAEGQKAVLKNFFGLDLDRPYEDIPLVEHPHEIDHNGWSGYVYCEDIASSGEPLIFTSAISSDGILYLGLSAFTLHESVNGGYLIDSDPDLRSVYNHYLGCLAREDLKGVVIDLRNNPGGYVHDLDSLFSPFVGEDTPYLRLRTKDGANRLSYSPWTTISMQPNDDGMVVDEGVPIVILANCGSASCSETSILFFRALTERGRDVTVVGSATFGGFATIMDGEYLGPGPFRLFGGAMDIYCGVMEVTDLHGRSLEGKGHVPDLEIAFNYSEFSSGTDARLDAALSIIRTGNVQ